LGVFWLVLVGEKKINGWKIVILPKNLV